ncbi:Maf family protein [Myxococcota bacterium]|nr:Maf family protein [Myxococcota bacterium]
MYTLVLCSTATHRATLLRRLRVPFETARPDFDETGAEALPAPEMALTYAVGKARAVAPRFKGRNALLLAADQTPEIDGEVLRKASTPAEACAQLERLAGREHALHTATVLLDADSGRFEHVLTTVRLRMRALSPAQIARYVAADDPVGSAGGYTLEGLGVALFEAIDGQDDSAIVGLPLIAVTALLARFGIDPLGSP